MQDNRSLKVAVIALGMVSFMLLAAYTYEVKKNEEYKVNVKEHVKIASQEIDDCYLNVRTRIQETEDVRNELGKAKNKLEMAMIDMARSSMDMAVLPEYIIQAKSQAEFESKKASIPFMDELTRNALMGACTYELADYGEIEATKACDRELMGRVSAE